jgi:hypothetical protein
MALFDFETQQEARVDLHGELPDRHVTMHFVVRGTAAFPLSFADHDHYSDFGTFKAGENKVGHQLQTVSRGSLPLQWDKITCRSDDPGLTIKFNPLDGNHWQLDMSYGPKDFLGDVTSYVVFTFWNNGRRLDYEQRYPIKATVVGPYYVAPQSVLFGAMRQGEQASQTIYVRSRDNKPVSIDKVIIQNDQSVRAVIVGRDHLVATYFADKVPGEHRGEMIVAIAGEPPYSVRIPYLASVIP